MVRNTHRTQLQIQSNSLVNGCYFSGCTINLVKGRIYYAFIQQAVERYEQKFKITPKVYDVIIKNGAGKIS